MLVTQSAFSHVCKLDRAFGACIHEPVAALWVEFCGCDDFSQFFHVRWLNIDYIEALVLNVQVPQIYAQIITADECFSIAVYGDAVDVVGVSIGVGSTRYSGHHSIVVCEAG